MNWKKTGAFEVGERCVEIRTLKIRDEDGRTRRLRTCTVWKPAAPDFSRTPATGRLVRTKDGSIGVLVSGKNMGHVKVGKTFLVQNTLMIPLGCVGKGVIKHLTGGADIILEEVDGIIMGFERT